MMDEIALYRKIADSIRQDILRGDLQPGDRLPSLRSLAAEWGCTVGTVQHAYRELADQGLVVGRPGQGTHVSGTLAQPEDAMLRRASLIHKSEAFLLEVLTSGYTPAEIESALRVALDRWRVLSVDTEPGTAEELRFAGSHDLALTWLATHFHDFASEFTLQLGFSGSLGGLMALAESRADLAGCHLYDVETDTYNVPFVRRIFPGQRMALVTLAHRWIGWIVRPGNPTGFKDIQDLNRPGLRFVNRRAGSGTRVWLDAALHKAGLAPEQIEGYQDECSTHTEVARLIAEGAADVGLGLGAAAFVYGLDFIRLTEERYDFVIPAEIFDQPKVQKLIEYLAQPEFHELLHSLKGYDPRQTGRVVWVE
jgi:molybdate-binding protein/DNA-binding transcriptional regulator YhcF (GntR family)